MEVLIDGIEKGIRDSVTCLADISESNQNVWYELGFAFATGTPVVMIVDELGYVPLSKTGAELLFEVFSRRYEQASTLVTSNLPFNEWTEIFGSERLTGALLDRLTHHVHILELNGESYRLAHSKKARHPVAAPAS